ncbi:MAG: NAD(P)(+) transhydrogenase (Re/Si-specific) subunit beta [Acidimicrobiia bacterium]|nr:NAD(P)(+) transhydrogenase (Re/Si-specific) subunit beta [Acidimicrobiia bacterium]MDH3471401.1 NAD(P)(+) transhydrogenase (Re/Si-specific) subunit beta [Acidimicrobiia bacterium]
MTELLYLACAAAFIIGLKRLGSPRTARTGNLIGATGMLGAVVITLVDRDVVDWGVIVAGLAVGTAVGAVAAVQVKMTAMPQMVAAFNGFGGLASALVAMSEFVRIDDPDVFANETVVTIAASVLIGAVTFSGSFVAFGKLQGIITGRPLTYPGQQLVNGVIAAGAIALIVWAIVDRSETALWLLGVATLLLGIILVLPIGGADMPVVISLLNSFSGLAASMAGFVIENTALIIGGALVGSAGLILTMLMTEAMNRPLTNVLFGAFGTGDGGGGAAGTMSDKPVKRATAADVAISLSYAQSVVIVPGYGLAVAQAQHATRALADALQEQGIKVNYAIHPVAGRMPGHMNVLLAEADVPYDQLLDLDHANSELAGADVAIILGANDVVNPSARDDADSPIYGMPILEVDRAQTVVVVKRSLSPGFAGIDNPLFYEDGTMMFFSDAKEALEAIAEALADV